MAVFAGSACAPGASTGPTIVRIGPALDFDFIAGSGDSYYQVNLVQGLSYVISDGQDYDEGLLVNSFVTSLYDSTASACGTLLAAGSATTGYKDITLAAPALPNNWFRGSVIAQHTGPYTIKVHNNDVNGHYVVVRVAESTLYSASWTENAPYHTYWAFSNTSSQAINGILTLTVLGGGNPSFSTNINAIPPGSSAGMDTATLSGSTPGILGHGGITRFAHDGPETALQATSTVTNFTTFTNQVAFVPLRVQ
jgi:hypothetical protein